MNFHKDTLRMVPKLSISLSFSVKRISAFFVERAGKATSHHEVPESRDQGFESRIHESRPPGFESHKSNDKLSLASKELKFSRIAYLTR